MRRFSLMPALSVAFALAMVIPSVGAADVDAESAAMAAKVAAFSQARHDLKLGFVLPGKVTAVHIKPGDRVKKGDVLIELEDREGLALMHIYKRRAESDLTIRSAQAQLKLAKIELKATEEAFQVRAATPIELERVQAREHVARLELELAELQQDEARQQYNQAVARHEHMILKSPLDGIIEQVVVSEGETVEQLKPVVRLVVIDPLWIDAPVPTPQTLGVKVGDPGYVLIRLPGYETVIEGKIVHMASVADAASNTRMVRVEIPNAEGLPAGTQVQVSFDRPGVLAQATGSSSDMEQSR